MKINNIKRNFDAWEEYRYWYKTNFNKINKLVKEIVRTPYQGTGKPEPLKKIYLVYGVGE